jgi:YD repeat-containing protein
LYGYDELNRLKTVDYGDGQTQSYDFDAMGNRSSKSDTIGGSTVTEAYSYDKLNELTARAGNAYTSDTVGNTLTGEAERTRGTRRTVW